MLIAPDLHFVARRESRRTRHHKASWLSNVVGRNDGNFPPHPVRRSRFATGKMMKARYRRVRLNDLLDDGKHSNKIFYLFFPSQLIAEILDSSQ
jgi:hypothetical protein